MDTNPQHESFSNLLLRFPGDPIAVPPAATTTTTATRPDEQQHQQTQQQQPNPPKQRQGASSKANPPSRPPTPPSSTYTVYIRVPALRNGFLDPPDVDWSHEKDDVLWGVLSRGSKKDIDWEELYAAVPSKQPLSTFFRSLIPYSANQFDVPVDFLLVQATILTERHVSQVRAQTRKVAALGGGVRVDSPLHSPARATATGGGSGSGNQSPSVGTAETGRFPLPDSQPRTGTPPPEAMGQTLSGCGNAGDGLNRFRAADGSGSSTPIGGNSRRPSQEPDQARPPQLKRNSLDDAEASVYRSDRNASRSDRTIPAPTAMQVAQTGVQPRRLLSSISIHPSASPDVVGRQCVAYKNGKEEANMVRKDGDDSESPTTTSSSSSSSSSTPSEPVTSRIFKRPPGYQQLQQKQREDVADRPSTLSKAVGGNDGDGRELGVPSSGESDDGNESETQAAFLPFKTPTLLAASSSKSGSSSHHHRPFRYSGWHPEQQPQRRQKQQSKKSSPYSLSASASPTTKALKCPTAAIGGLTRNGSQSSIATVCPVATGNSPAMTTATAVAAARLQSSRQPGVRSPPALHHAHSKRAAAANKGVPSASREGSETGTTPSMGSSFSDLDDVSLTQSVLDEALASHVEDTVVGTTGVGHGSSTEAVLTPSMRNRWQR
ncbi:multidomain presynaptic cytomatrix related protein [Niveomyces insectorum RCEF 264]|uniref:Autophagy-related protein 29 n=1 Tax=Niveomyces insectorum RCEF 264 TaxID=1081102 RepID=A0A167LXW7_9HYPO|nr:multidomain presynaptic cytomatrix related protein [Niveomyces insectorum RCEF 264]